MTRTTKTLIAVLAVVGLAYCAAGDTNFTNLVASGDITAGDDLTVTDDATIGGALTVTGALSQTGAVTLTGGAVVPDDADVNFGTDSDALMSYDVTTQDPDALFIGVPTASRQVIIAEAADIGTDLAFAQNTNPTLQIHSADATTAGDYIYFNHDQTDANIVTGAGNLNLNPAGGTTAVTGALTVSSTTTSTGLLTATAGLAVTDDRILVTIGTCAASCTVGELCIDNSNTVELCYCITTDTFHCWDETTADGPKD